MAGKVVVLAVVSGGGPRGLGIWWSLLNNNVQLKDNFERPAINAGTSSAGRTTEVRGRRAQQNARSLYGSIWETKALLTGGNRKTN